MAVLARRRTEEKPFAGLRSMDPMKDLRGVADLIEEAFATDLDRSGQSALQELRWLSRLKPVLWWMVYASPDHTDFLSGFVWEEDKKIVGNITINRTSVGSRRWLISNLAVSKNYRGQGIARGLMYAAIELVKEYSGASVSLQVRADNEVARHLYESLNFKEISGTSYLWVRRVPKVEAEPLPKGLVWRTREADVNDSREAYTLASIATPLSVQKEWPLRHSQFRLNQGEGLANFFRWFGGGGPSAHWVIEDEGRLIALINIKPGTWGQAHHIELVVHPDWRGKLEKPLISRALNYLYPWRNRNIFIKHPAYHPEAIDVYKEFGFVENQTLIWMKREL